MKFFKYDNEHGNLIIDNDSILLVKEFQKLLDVNRNKSKSDKSGINKEKAFKELTYIYLYLDWESPYFYQPEQDKHQAALQDSGLTDEEFQDEIFKEACKKYELIQNENINLRMLKACMASVEKIIFYFETVDINERDPVTGKPIYSSKDLISNIKNARELVISLRELETQVKKDLEQSSGLRGNVEAGYFD